MRLLGYMAAAALLAGLAIGPAQAQYQDQYQSLPSSYVGPVKIGNMCFFSNHHGVSFGYWEHCKPEASAASAHAQGRHSYR